MKLFAKKWLKKHSSFPLIKNIVPKSEKHSALLRVDSHVQRYRWWYRYQSVRRFQDLHPELDVYLR